ncbi:SpoIIE family protein phosphatase [candidate division KSB1 bacterium]|nr:SpoIIE family protein phosphatase [candidate division KSB1 bacterium]
MLNPKDFYRKLDTLFSEIYKVGGLDILSTVLEELVYFLGRDLNIVDGRLYEENVTRFDLINCTGDRSYPNSISKKDTALNLIISHGCYIFNEPHDVTGTSLENNYRTIPVAFVVSKEEKQWIFIFELASGWEREEIEFSLNTIRMILNSRISTDHFQDYIHQAELIQRSLLPEKMPEVESYDIAAKSIPTEIVGGDLYDFILYDDKHVGVAIGDASGHGLPAALLVRDVVTGMRMGMEKHLKMTYALEKLNRVIYQSRLSTSFISLFYAEVETNGNIIYVNAGHPTPLLIKEYGIEEFTIGGVVLGPMPHVKLKRGFNFMEKGDILLLYTDGLLERQNRLGEPFEMQRLKQLAFEKKNLSATEILEQIISEVYNFGNKRKWVDDVTIVVIKKNE